MSRTSPHQERNHGMTPGVGESSRGKEIAELFSLEKPSKTRESNLPPAVPKPSLTHVHRHQIKG